MSEITHDQLWDVCRQKGGDYDPWGFVKRWENDDQAYPDCSEGCKWFVELDGDRGADWGVCCNPNGHRAGLLTFEHQGCLEFEGEDDE